MEIERIAGPQFIIIPFRDDVSKIEVEIIYDPHLKTDRVDADQLLRQFTQVDTSTNAFMEGSIGQRNFNRVNSSDYK